MSWRYGAEFKEYPLCFGRFKTNTILPRVKGRSCSFTFKEEFLTDTMSIQQMNFSSVKLYFHLGRGHPGRGVRADGE